VKPIILHHTTCQKPLFYGRFLHLLPAGQVATRYNRIPFISNHCLRVSASRRDMTQQIWLPLTKIAAASWQARMPATIDQYIDARVCPRGQTRSLTPRMECVMCKIGMRLRAYGIALLLIACAAPARASQEAVTPERARTTACLYRDSSCPATTANPDDAAGPASADDYSCTREAPGRAWQCNYGESPAPIPVVDQSTTFAWVLVSFIGLAPEGAPPATGAWRLRKAAAL